jgi:ABC-2 type transport system permease protein
MTALARWWAQARAIVRRDILIDVRYRLAFVIGLVDAALILVSYSFLSHVFQGAPPDGYPPRAFVLVGVALTDSLTTAVVCLALGVRYGQQTGTVKVLLAEPLTPARLMSLSLVYPVLRGAVDFACFLLVGMWLGVPVASINPVSVAVVFVASAAAVLGIGLFSAAATLIFKRGDPVLWALGTATALLSGVLYPTSVLPDGLQRVAGWLPTTQALAAMRAAVIDGAGLGALAPHLAALGVFAVGGLALGLAAFDGAARYARRAGTLGQL